MSKEKAMFFRWSKICLLFVSSVSIAWLHPMLIHDQITYSVLEELYYFPLLLGSLMFGLRGALVTYLLVSVLYLFHAYTNWEVSLLAWLDLLQHLLFSGMFTFLAGYLVDRERKSRKQLEKAQYLAGIGKVATTIVHDLKNSLITILGFAKRIKEKKGNTDDASGTGQDINILLSQGQDYLAIRIQDHGAGMDKGTVENMFIPFYSNKNNGTGLGMPIAKKIVEGHEGTIDIESHPGTGTEVLIRLPYRSGNQ
jgi:signal transduction histidine kinase